MNVPKGNAVALQALKPIENKTADILSGYVFELIKQGNAEKAAKLKALEEFVVQLNEEQKKQSNQLQISSELREKMKEINQTLNKNIFEMNYQLFEDNYQKKK